MAVLGGHQRSVVAALAAVLVGTLVAPGCGSTSTERAQALTPTVTERSGLVRFDGITKTVYPSPFRPAGE